jgi:hypothetical protein
MIERLPTNVGYDRILYHAGVIENTEIGLAQADRGEGTEYEEFFAALLAEDTNGGANPLIP